MEKTIKTYRNEGTGMEVLLLEDEGVRLKLVLRDFEAEETVQVRYYYFEHFDGRQGPWKRPKLKPRRLLLTKRRTIRLPAIERTVPLGTYTAAVKLAIANPNREFKHGLTTWWSTSGREIRQQFLEGVHDRINQSIPYFRRGL